MRTLIYQGIRYIKAADDSLGITHQGVRTRRTRVGEGYEGHEAKIGKSTLDLTIRPNKKHIELHSLRTPVAHRGKGHADTAMRWLTSLADERGHDISLGASPLDKRTHTNKLVAFYRKHGFETTGHTINPLGHPEMLRKARPIA